MSIPSVLSLLRRLGSSFLSFQTLASIVPPRHLTAVAAIVASGPAPAPMRRSTPELEMQVTTAPAMSPSGIKIILTPSFLRFFSI